MSLGAQFRQLNKQASAFRQELIGTDAAGAKVIASYDLGQLEGIQLYYHFVKRRYWTQEAGAIEQQGAILRIPKDQPTLNQRRAAADRFVPSLTKQITFKDATGRELTFVIEDFLGTHLAAAEWVLGCRLL